MYKDSSSEANGCNNTTLNSNQSSPLEADSPLSLPNSLSVTPSSSDATTNSSNATTIETRLYQACLVLECQQLCDQYDLCRAQLHHLLKELELLRQENAELRVANSELVHELSLLSHSTFRNCFLFHDSHVTKNVCSLGTTKVMDDNLLKRRTDEGITLPKGMSVTSSHYVTKKQQIGQDGGPSPPPSRQREPLQLQAEGINSLHVKSRRGIRKKDDESWFKDQNRGKSKTELCNKWEESGACPYGNNCQFAHGVSELRPIARHPHYKTKVCRMMLAGDTCPYGHRCHFRHSLTGQERFLYRSFDS